MSKKSQAYASLRENAAGEFFDLSMYGVDDGVQRMQETLKPPKRIAEYIASEKKALENGKWPANYVIADTPEHLTEIERLVREDGEMIFDTETDSLNPWRGKVYCVSIWAGGKAFVIPFEHKMMPRTIGRETFRYRLGPLFNDPEIRLMNHNIKFDAHFIREQLGIEVGWLYCDTLLQAWIVDPSSESKGLKELCAYYGLAGKAANYKGQFGKIAWSCIDPLVASYYACHDVELVALLHEKQNQLLAKKPKLSKLFWNLEMFVLNEAYHIERIGMRVDTEYVEKTLKPTVYTEYAKAVNDLAPFIEPHLAYAEASTVAQVCESPSKLGKVFFECLGLPETKNVTLRKKKQDGDNFMWVRSLDKEAIAYYKRDYEYMRLLGAYRQVATVKKMFVDKLPHLVIDGRIHPNINVTGTETGRMSMSNPNLQQIPSRMGPLVRNMFIPDDGNIFFSIDFSQQELRWMAHYSQDERLMKVFFDDSDLYIDTAIGVLDVPASDFDPKIKTPDQIKEHPLRKLAKILVLGLQFGMGPAKYAKNTGQSKDKGIEQHAKYYQTYPGVKGHQDRTAAFARKTGYITTILGRERPLPHINSTQKGWRGKAERAAGNTPIQGSSADQTKLASKKVKALITIEGWPVRIWLFVHDEIIFEANAAWVKHHPQAIDAICKLMESAIPMRVPMKSTVTLESRWGTKVKADEIDDEFDDLEEAA